MKVHWKRAVAAAGLTLALVSGSLFGGYQGAETYSVSAAEATEPFTRIRVDLNANNFRTNERSTLFDNWVVENGKRPSATFAGVTFTLSDGGTGGKDIKASSYKRLICSDGNSPLLTLDGVMVDGVTNGGVIRMEISGLAPGEHTLKTWHSYYDDVEGGPLSITIDGKKTASQIAVSKRVTKDENAGMSYSRFTAEKGKTVTVLIAPEGKGSAVLNAFEVDGADPFHTICEASPADADTHFDQKKGLTWKAGKGAVSHEVYQGTSYEAVNTADHQSPEYKGAQTDTSYPLSGLTSLETYYWRVDEIAEDGTVCKGETKQFQVARLAFPTAEGYGRYARGGRGGRVIEVTNLNDSGPGSLRQAVEVEKGPRIVVFRVGGVIELKSKLTVPSDGGDLYVAGQTAPGDGITLTKYNFGIYYASDVIIRHIRVRVGDESGVTMDGMGMAGANHSIIDHCSISWGTDEGTSSRGARNITFQHNIIAEGLNNSIHYNAGDRDQTERHSFAGSISGNIGSFHHNLLVHNTGRNWSLAGGVEQDGAHYSGKLDVRNNVIYNYQNRTTDGGVKQINFVNNYYKMGPVSKNMRIFSIDGNEMSYQDMQMAYLSGNKQVKTDGTVLLDANENAWEKGKATALKNATVAQVRSDRPFFPSYVTTQTADEAYQSVLADVGATLPKQDALDARYIRETKEGTYTYTGSKDRLKGIIDSQTDVGGYPDASSFAGGTAPEDGDHDGMPDAWEILHGLNPKDASDANATNLSAEDYTNIEMYLNELAHDPLVWAEETAPTPSETPEPKPTQTSAPTPSAMPTQEPEATPTPTPSAMPTPSATPTSSATPTPMPTPSKTPDQNPEWKLGDVNNDKQITADDALQVLKMVVKLKQADERELFAADVDKNQDVNASDALQILKYVVRIIDSFSE